MHALVLAWVGPEDAGGERFGGAWAAALTAVPPGPRRRACSRSWDVAGRPFSLAKINALQTEIVSRDSRVPRPSRRALHRTSVCLLRLRRSASNRTRSWWRARGR